jgi:hypothetical protein
LVKKINYDNPQTIVDALQGQEVLIISLSVGAKPETESIIVSAAAKAGVSWIFPNEYGADPAHEQAGRDALIGIGKVQVRNQIEELGVSKWIALCCGFWYEWSLPLGTDTFGFDIKNRRVIFFDDGNTKQNVSTWPQCGRAVAAVLGLKVLPDDESDTSLTLSSFANKPLYSSSFFLSQRDMFESVLRVTGTKESDWKIEHEASKERFEQGQEQFKTGDRRGFAKLLYSRYMFPDGSGILNGNKTHNQALGLPEEDLDEWTKFCVDFAEAGKSWF